MEENKSLSGRIVTTKKFIELYGVLGEFNLSNKSTKVSYFSTMASGKDKRSDSYTLLKELKPMRERVKASDIKNLASLLQRNLDDFRVAFELIPYLQNPQIAFFPAILGVLIPNKFLTSQNGLYPNKEVVQSEPGRNTIISYENKWKVETFNIGNDSTPLGILSIDISEIEIVVLDGQHRANAFRVASGAFDEHDSSVYPAFYQGLLGVEQLNADLPLTLVWFDVDDSKFDPRYVSRRLFVDVNNSAKKVSKSRRILLNDYEIPSLLTRFFYSAVAEAKSFSLDSFSLFQSEFDKDSDINVSSNNSFALTNPEIIHEVFSWLILGSRRFNNLETYRVNRENQKNNVAAFSEVFHDEEFNDKDINPFGEYLNTPMVVIQDSLKISIFEAQYNKLLHNVIYNFYNYFNFYRSHYLASKSILDWYNDGMNSTQRIVWEEVFNGGEGLYYTFKNNDLKEKPNQTLENYRLAVDEIEKRFRSLRAAHFTGVLERDINAAYESANTKAFQVGFFMALNYYKDSRFYLEAIEELMMKINSIAQASWVIILTEIKTALIPGVDPKLWPAYQKLILRVTQKSDRTFYSKDNFLESPDGMIFKSNLKKAFDAWWNSQEDLLEEDLSFETVGNDNISRWALNSKSEVDELFKKANVETIAIENINDVARNVLGAEITRINPPVKGN